MPKAHGTSALQTLGVVCVLVLMLLYLVLSWRGVQETRDAERIEAAQVALQSALSQGVATLHLAPREIDPGNVVNSARRSFPAGVNVNRGLHLTLMDSTREAQFDVTPDGNLDIIALNNFTRFHLDGGRLARTNHWVFSF